MLPKVLEKDLRIVFCGTAAGKRSAELQMYYAGQGNKFWRVLEEVDLTPELLSPHQYTNLPQYRIGRVPHSLLWEPFRVRLSSRSRSSVTNSRTDTIPGNLYSVSQVGFSLAGG